MNDSSSPVALYDAHCHLDDEALTVLLERDPHAGQVPPIVAQVVNGTHPDNWPRVAAMEGFLGSRSLKAFGVHPWRVGTLAEDWEDQLRKVLKKGAVSVGEIGLDNYVEPRNEALQRDVFMRQLAIAAELELPPSIHCVHAQGQLIDCLGSGPTHSNGFLAHGFSGSKEVLYQLLDMGGHFSFSAYAAHPGRKRIRDVIRACPQDRLLAETDCPHMVPPAAVCLFPLQDEEGNRLQHPGEIESAYAFLAECRSENLGTLAAQIEKTFKRLFR